MAAAPAAAAAAAAAVSRAAATRNRRRQSPPRRQTKEDMLEAENRRLTARVKELEAENRQLQLEVRKLNARVVEQTPPAHRQAAAQRQAAAPAAAQRHVAAVAPAQRHVAAHRQAAAPAAAYGPAYLEYLEEHKSWRPHRTDRVCRYGARCRNLASGRCPFKFHLDEEREQHYAALEAMAEESARDWSAQRALMGLQAAGMLTADTFTGLLDSNCFGLGVRLVPISLSTIQDVQALYGAGVGPFRTYFQYLNKSGVSSEVRELLETAAYYVFACARECGVRCSYFLRDRKDEEGFTVHYLHWKVQDPRRQPSGR